MQKGSHEPGLPTSSIRVAKRSTLKQEPIFGSTRNDWIPSLFCAARDDARGSSLVFSSPSTRLRDQMPDSSIRILECEL